VSHHAWLSLFFDAFQSKMQIAVHSAPHTCISPAGEQCCVAFFLPPFERMMKCTYLRAPFYEFRQVHTFMSLQLLWTSLYPTVPPLNLSVPFPESSSSVLIQHNISEIHLYWCFSQLFAPFHCCVVFWAFLFVCFWLYHNVYILLLTSYFLKSKYYHLFGVIL
jgi:hypothetical protein